MLTVKLLSLLLAALVASWRSSLASTMLPLLVPEATGQAVVLDGWGAADTLQGSLQPLAVDASASSVTIRRATLRGVLLLLPEPSAPVALAFAGPFLGPWYLEDLVIYVSSCDELGRFSDLACDLQPTTWIESRGWSVTIHSFVPPGAPGAKSTFTLSNVTLTCDAGADSMQTLIPSGGSSELAAPSAACVTTTVASQGELLALLSYDATRYGKPLPPPSARLHVTLTTNMSLDVPTWTAVHPVLTRGNTTLSGDCAPGRVTSLDLAGATSLVGAVGGAKLRLMCLELVNLGTETLYQMPRGLLSGAVWAVDVDTAAGSQLWLDNCTLVLTKDEFVWQSYYVTQVLTNTVIGNLVTSVLNRFEASMTSSHLLWTFAWSPHTRWRDCIFTTTTTVYNITVPNSFIMRYLGHSMYLTDLRMAYSCDRLLKYVRNLTYAAVPSVTQPYAIILGTNISLATCWPPEGVAVASQALAIMGLPDRTTTLNLSGRSDAFRLPPGGSLSLRFITLLGLARHSDSSDDSLSEGGDVGALEAAAATSAATSPSPASSSSSSSSSVPPYVRLTSLMWAFHFSRLGLQLQLENVNVMMPYVELQQFGKMAANKTDLLPYFSSIKPYISASRVGYDPNVSAKSTAPPGASGPVSLSPSSSAPGATSVGTTNTTVGTTNTTVGTTNTTEALLVDPTGQTSAVVPTLSFEFLVLPGIRGLNVKMTSWPGEYTEYTAAMYDATGGGGGDGGSGAVSSSGGWAPWKVGLLAAGVGLAMVAVMAAALLYGRHRRGSAADGVGAASLDGSSGSAKRMRDLEAGGVSGGDGRGGHQRGAGGASSGVAGARSREGGALQVAERQLLYDSFDDPVFELDVMKRTKLTSEDIHDILDRVNAEAAEFNIQMTEICGSGSFGVVYGGLWHGLKVAIKTMVFAESSPHLMSGKMARQQCIHEAALCCTMHHPNVVATHHFYLKSAKRATMFDDLLQQIVESSSDGEQPYRRPTKRPPSEAASPPFAGLRGMDSEPPPPPPPAGAQEDPVPESDDPHHHPPSDGPEGPTAFASASATAAATAAAAPPATATADDGQGAADRDAVDHGGAGDGDKAGGAGGGRGSEGGQPGVKAAAPRGPLRPLRRRERPFWGLPPFKPCPVVKTKTAVTDWRLYLIQEYCDGGTLREAVDGRTLFRHEGEKRGGADRAATAAAASAAAAALQTPRERIVASAFTTPPEATGDGGDAGGGGGLLDDRHSNTVSECLIPEFETVIAEANASIAEANASLLDLVATTAVAAGPSAVAVEPSIAVQRLRAFATMDSGCFAATTVTNASCESMSLGTAANTCSDANNTTQATTVTHTPPPPPPAPVVPAAVNPIPADLVVVIHTALGIASGVAYLHSRSIIHGDLSANNVLLTKTSLPEVPVVAKLSDFGLSMRLEQGQDQLKDVHHGTPYYQSPEVMERGTCSLAADVYSLGVLLWELYHGPPPWRAKPHKVHKPFRIRRDSDSRRDSADPQQQQQQQQQQQPPEDEGEDGGLWDDPHYKLRACDVLQIAAHCPPRYARLVRRCLSADPRDRPSALSVVKTLFSMERGMAAAEASVAGAASTMSGAPVGALMALTRPHLAAVPGRTRDAALLLEDFDAAAAAVAAAVAHVTAAPTIAGAPASAGAVAVAAQAAKAGAVSSSLLAVSGAQVQRSGMTLQNGGKTSSVTTNASEAQASEGRESPAAMAATELSRLGGAGGGGSGGGAAAARSGDRCRGGGIQARGTSVSRGQVQPPEVMTLE